MQKYLWCILFSWTLFGSTSPEIKALDAETAIHLFKIGDPSVTLADEACAQLNPGYIFWNEQDALLLTDNKELYKIPAYITNPTGHFSPFAHERWKKAHTQCRQSGATWTHTNWTLGKCPDCGEPYYENAKGLLSHGMIWTYPDGYIFLRNDIPDFNISTRCEFSHGFFPTPIPLFPKTDR